MASLNKVFLMGNLTRDPELRYIPGTNSAVCEFGIAVNRRFVQAGGQEKDETCFVEIVVWGKQAESCSRYLQKGASVLIEGRLVYDQWVERDTQKKRSRLRVTAERVQFTGSRRDDGGAPAQEGPEEDPTRQGYSSPRPAAPRAQGQPYTRQSYDAPSRPQQQVYRSRPQQQEAAPSAPAENAMPEGDPFENVDDIPF